MTSPVERTRALLWAGGFLIEVAWDKTLPLALRREAVVIARHYPTIEQVAGMARDLRPFFCGSGLASPDAMDPDLDMGRHGPLTWHTRLGWPEEA